MIKNSIESVKFKCCEIKYIQIYFFLYFFVIFIHLILRRRKISFLSVKTELYQSCSSKVTTMCQVSTFVFKPFKYLNYSQYLPVSVTFNTCVYPESIQPDFLQLSSHCTTVYLFLDITKFRCDKNDLN